MPAAVTLNLVAAVTVAIQLLIFVYLHRSHRARFFHYLLWAWGCYFATKASDVGRLLAPTATVLGRTSLALGIAGDFLILASALAFRRGYAIRPWHAVLVSAYAALAAARSPIVAMGPGGHGPGGVMAGLVLVVAGAVFWPRRQEPASPAGRRFLAASLALWGLHRIAAPWAAPTEAASVALNVTFVLIYSLVVFGIVIVVLDGARVEAAALKEFNERLIDGLGEGLQLVDDRFAVRHANRWVLEHLRRPEGSPCHQGLTADGQACPGCPLPRRASLAAPVRLAVTGPGGRRFELTCSPVRQPDGRVFLLELVTDVTERERLQARLAEAERLASVGELAAGVAHEIRNPLAAIVNASTLLDADVPLAPDERGATIGVVRKEARRLNAILSDFLRFARPAEPHPVEGDLRDVVTHVAALVGEPDGGHGGMTVDTRVEPDVPRFPFDPDQVTQVLLNVALNAREAMKGGGRLAIHARREGGEAVVEVADSGPGMPPEDLRRIFEPFYSRRFGGTGLGLPIARRIVAAHGGRIDVESAVGHGTRVLIRLPVSG